MMDDKEAVSPIISMILLITIVLVVTAAILQWATPILQRSQSEANYSSALGYFNVLDSAFEDVVNMGEGASRTGDVSVGAGNIYISETMNETWVVSYGLNESVRIRFSEVDGGDNMFKINSTKTVDVNITIYWPEGDDLGEPDYVYQGPIGPASPASPSAKHDLVGTVYIRVNTTGPSQETLAELWLFDITPITYELPSAFGTYYIKSVNGGIITQATGQKYVTDEPRFKETGSSVLLYMIQTRATNLRSGGPGSYSFTLNVNNMNIRNNLSVDVYNLTLQIYDATSGNKWGNAWHSHFLTGWKNAEINHNEIDYVGFVDDGEVLLYKTNNTDNPELYGTKPVTLKLMSCTVDVNMKSK